MKFDEFKLEQVLESIFSGGTPSTQKKNYWDGEFSWLSSGETRNNVIRETKNKISEEGIKNSSTKLAQIGDIVMASAGQGYTRGQTSILCIDTYINQSVIALRANEEILDNKYLYYNLSSRYKELRALSDSSSIRGSITTKMLKQFSIKIPKMKYQKKVVNILWSLDSKIELNNQIISNLEELASTLFKRWFVDFEFPDENGNPYKSSGGKMVDSELGEIPEGWGIKKLGEISRIQNGYAFKSKDYIEYSVDNSVKVLRTLNINNDNLTINNKDLVYLPEFFLKHHSNVVLNKFDTLFVMVGATIGKVGLVTDINLPSLQNQNMWRFRPDFPHLSSVILRHYVIHSRNIAENWKTGSAREFYRKDSFSNIRLAIAENRILDKLNSILQPIYELINKKNYENGQLEGLRDSLLPKLLSGEIELPEDEEV